MGGEKCVSVEERPGSVRVNPPEGDAKSFQDMVDRFCDTVCVVSYLVVCKCELVSSMTTSKLGVAGYAPF